MEPIILIPTLNRYDYLTEALTYYSQQPHKVLILDNGRQFKTTYRNVSVIQGEPENCVAKSWNILIEKATAYGFQNYFLFNDDIIFKTPKYLKCMYMNLDLVVSPTSFYAVYLTNKLVQRVGPFDERFKPAYFEDVDFLHRCKLVNIPWKRDSIHLLPDVLRESSTITNHTLLRKIHRDNLELYKQKWGGIPSKETIKHAK